MLIDKRESTGLKHLNDSKAFSEYSNDTDDICKNIEELSAKYILSQMISSLICLVKQKLIQY